VFGLSPATSRCSQFDKRSQLFIRTRNEALSVASMRVSNPDRSTLQDSELRASLNSIPQGDRENFVFP
jgi:hypothetical protein